MPRTVRTLLVALVALAAWLVAGSAVAAAPICDVRGASAFAPPPTLDAQNASVDVGTGAESCGYALDDGASLHQGRAHDPLPAPAGVDLLPVVSETAVLAPSSRAVRLDLVAAQGRLGVHGRLERPPDKMAR